MGGRCYILLVAVLQGALLTQSVEGKGDIYVKWLNVVMTYGMHMVYWIEG